MNKKMLFNGGLFVGSYIMGSNATTTYGILVFGLLTVVSFVRMFDFRMDLIK